MDDNEKCPKGKNRGQTQCHFGVGRNRVRGQFGWLDRRCQTGCSEAKIANFRQPVNASINVVVDDPPLQSPLPSVLIISTILAIKTFCRTDEDVRQLDIPVELQAISSQGNEVKMVHRQSPNSTCGQVHQRPDETTAMPHPLKGLPLCATNVLLSVPK